jgi:zinc protease
LRPSFPAEEVERQRGQRLTQIIQRHEDPNATAGTAVAAALYGFKHPYGFIELGTEAATKAITRDDIAAFWKQNFVPNNAALVVAGAITSAELRGLVEKAFGAWQAGAPAQPSLGVPETTKAKLVLVDMPGAAQTELRVATIGAPRSTPDYFPLEVMNSILGGLFSSRVNLNLREAHGWTYGAYSVFQYRKAAGPFFVATGVRRDVTGPAVGETLKEIARIGASPISADELELARDSLVRSLPGLFETNAGTVGSFAGVFVYDLGLDYYARYAQQIAAVTAANVQDVAKRYLVPEKLVIVAVGDRSKIAPQLEKLPLGPPELRDADGNLKR